MTLTLHSQLILDLLDQPPPPASGPPAADVEEARERCRALRLQSNGSDDVLALRDAADKAAEALAQLRRRGGFGALLRQQPEHTAYVCRKLCADAAREKAMLRFNSTSKLLLSELTVSSPDVCRCEAQVAVDEARVALAESQDMARSVRTKVQITAALSGTLIFVLLHMWLQRQSRLKH